jgi:hypothetical protein
LQAVHAFSLTSLLSVLLQLAHVVALLELAICKVPEIDIFVVPRHTESLGFIAG